MYIVACPSIFDALRKALEVRLSSLCQTDPITSATFDIQMQTHIKYLLLYVQIDYTPWKAFDGPFLLHNPAFKDNILHGR